MDLDKLAACMFLSVTLKPPKTWYLFTKLHSIIFQKSLVCPLCTMCCTTAIVYLHSTAGWTSNLFFFKQRHFYQSGRQSSSTRVFILGQSHWKHRFENFLMTFFRSTLVGCPMPQHTHLFLRSSVKSLLLR